MIRPYAKFSSKPYKPVRPAHSMPPKKHSRLVRNFLTIMMAGMLLATVFPTQPAQAQFAGVVSVISDIPGQIFRAVDKATKYVNDKLKIVNDVAFKNSLRVFTATLTRETITYLSSGGAGQRGLFIQNAGTFIRDAASAAAGDYIDSYTKARFGTRGPGKAISDARLRFVVSRYLREAAFSQGTPVEQCQKSVTAQYGIGNYSKTDFPNNASLSSQKVSEIATQFNQHTANIAFVQHEIDRPSGGSAQAAAEKNTSYYCRGVAPTAGPGVTWIIDPAECNTKNNTPSCSIDGVECKRRQEEAILNERHDAQQQVTEKVRECKNGLAGAYTDLFTAYTSKDLVGALQSSNPAAAGKAVANALNHSTSDIGQLLEAAAALEVAVQDRVTGEQTKLSPGVLPRTTKVSGKTLAPTAAITALFGVPITTSANADNTYTGTGVADVLKGIASFINSPVGKGLFTYLKSQCGINPEACKGPSNPSSPLAQLLFGSGNATGLAGAQIQFAGLGQADFITGDPGRGEVGVTDQLASAGFIDAQFRSAIEEQVTVQQALSKGLLDAKKLFGFDANGDQPSAGYPFQALQYLRKFRVIPVGWELAASYSKQYDPRDLSLGFLTKQFDQCGQDDQHQVCSGGAKPGSACTTDSECGVDPVTTIDGQCTASPYCGLVDPNWVLKAPRTFCRRQGAGEEIISKEFVCDVDNVLGPGDTQELGQNPPNCDNQSTQTGHDVGRWLITRNSDTCADTQSCVAENDDGTCRAYGYCVQERQTFKFSGTQCTAENATCTSYSTSNGDTNSFLANTLDFRTCSADVAGCQWYCRDQAADGQWMCTDTTGSKQNFTGQVKTCKAGDAGCHEYLRTVNGTNLLPNSGFEAYAGTGVTIDGPVPAIFSPWLKIGGVSTLPVTPDDPSVTGNNAVAVLMQGSAGEGLSQRIDSGYSLYERSFTGTVRAKSAGSCTLSMVLDSDAGDSVQDLVLTSSWNTYGTSLSIPSQGIVNSADNHLAMRITLQNCPGGATIDSAQLEENSGATNYKDYGAVNAIYLNGTRQQCTAADVGCEKYTPVAGGSAVTAVAKNGDHCSADVVGCATYNLEQISNLPVRSGGNVNIVAPKGKLCSAAEVGCEEYTNLDELASGGEAKAYFKSIKQCVKPTNSKVDITTYYTWVGSADHGFVLRSYDLVKSTKDAGPCTNLTLGTTTTDPSCNDNDPSVTIAACSANDLASNPDCAEYYDQNLQVYYRLRSRTITPTAECHPYRNTIDQAAGDNYVYYLAPRENSSCSAAAAGCRAFTGNAGRATRTLLKDTFERTSTNWVGGTRSNESVSLNGHSMKITLPPPPATKTSAYTTTEVLANKLTIGKSYLVSFIAAAADDPGANPLPVIEAYFGKVAGPDFEGQLAFPTGGSANAQWNPNITPPGPEWHPYTFGPVVADQIYPNFGITAKNGSIYVDNVVLTEINDSLYLINNSAPVCQAKDIGCAAYRDRRNTTTFLKSFSHICSELVVGCEALIDTQNSTSPLSQDVKGVVTPADAVVRYVNDSKAYCSAAAKGCQAFGQPTYSTDQRLSAVKTTYLIDNPDRHQTDLCLANEVSCQAYTLDNGASAFFKDPTGRTCEYRADQNQWVITGTSIICPTVTPPTVGRPVGASCSPYCAGGERDGKACATPGSANECPGGGICRGSVAMTGRIVDPNDNSQTIVGQCSDNNDCPVATPGNDQNHCTYLAGMCPDQQNGCNEYRDPSDPPGCRSACPLTQDGGSSVYVDGNCSVTHCQGGIHNGQNCQTSQQCGTGGKCVGADNTTPIQGVPGCRPYYYLRQSIEDQASECNGQVNTATGCQPFNDTSKGDLYFRGQ